MARYLAAGIFLVGSLSSLRFAVNYQLQKTAIYYLDLPLALLLGSLAYLFFKYAIAKEVVSRIKIAALLFPGTLVLIVTVIANLTLFEPGNPPQSMLRAALFSFGTIMLNVGIFVSMRSIWKGITTNFGHREWALHGLLFWFATLIVVNLRSMTTFVYIWLPFAANYVELLTVLGEISLVVYLSLVWSRYPEALNELSLQIRKVRGKYERSSLGNLDLPELHLRLNEAMEEKVYCDEDLTLPRLSDMLGVTPHQLSEFLNTQMGCGFPKYINAKRIEEAMKSIQEESERPLSSIATSVGFASSSAFFRAFRSQTGLSPKVWRDNLLEKSGNSRAKAS